MDSNNLDKELDWEYMSDFYTNKEERKVRTLEEIAGEVKEVENDGSTISINEPLQKAIQDVKNVKRELAEGADVKEISKQLALSEDYVTTILMTVEVEESDIAAAHLLLLESEEEG